MDSKDLSRLDPKLREAYERVMGTPTSRQPQTQTPLPTPEPPPVQANEPQQVHNAPSEQVPAPAPHASSSVIAFNAQTYNKKSAGVKSGSLTPVIIGVGIVILLLAYTFVWVKIFNLSIPFLP
jgi:hypothetical protein